MLNQFVGIGRLVRDVEIKYTPTTGNALANFTIAIDRQWQAGNKEKETDFIRVICWGKMAEACNNHIGKGSLVAVAGSLQIRQWTDKAGERRSATEINAFKVEFLERAKAGGGGGAADKDSYSERDNDGYRSAPDDSATKPAAKSEADINKEVDAEIDLSEDPF